LCGSFPDGVEREYLLSVEKIVALTESIVATVGASAHPTSAIHCPCQVQLFSPFRFVLKTKLDDSMHIAPAIEDTFDRNLIFQRLVIDDVITLADNPKTQPMMASSPCRMRANLG